MPAGEYELFADLVHETGVSETVSGTLAGAGDSGGGAAGDDSASTVGVRSGDPALEHPAAEGGQRAIPC